MLAQTLRVVERNEFREKHPLRSIPLSADEHHSARGRHEIRGIDAVAVFFFIDDRPDVSLHILVGGSFAEKAAQVVIFFAEEAGSQLSVGSETDAGTMAAERLSHGRNQADFTGSAV